MWHRADTAPAALPAPGQLRRVSSGIVYQQNGQPECNGSKPPDGRETSCHHLKNEGRAWNILLVMPETLLLAAIADDYTGGSDMAGMLAAHGVRTLQTF